MPKTQPRQEFNFQLKITLKGSRPSIWRRVVVPGSFKLSRVHRVFQIVMGWNDSHLHQFTISGSDFGLPDPESSAGQPILSERRFRLDQVVHSPRQHFTYVYDFGDYWIHHVVAESILPADPSQLAPLCLEGKRACPPDDIGNLPGYAEFLKAIRNPRHDDHRDMLAWIGGTFDPDAFDVDEVNRQLKQRSALS